jgi:serine/threonine-protein kinase ATR
VYQQLVYVMERVVQEYSQQAIWTMVGVLYSKENQRKDRCAQIIKRAQANMTKRSPLAGNTFAMTFRTLDSLVRSFLAIAGLKTDSYATLSMAQQFPALKAVVPCDIIIPLQNAMTISLPTDNQVNSHRPFPSNLVTFQGFKDEIEIMTSVAKPRKLVIYGSDGLSYRFLCKPLDDLRKDNRFNECTSLINRLLMKDAAARKRGLREYPLMRLTFGAWKQAGWG